MRALKFNTDGKGTWSRKVAAVRINDVRIHYFDEDDKYGELRVYFNTSDWDIDKNGLIYTDNRFLRDLQGYLNSRGLPGRDVDYSEAGMQGDDYVSFDISGQAFLDAWKDESL